MKEHQMSNADTPTDSTTTPDDVDVESGTDPEGKPVENPSG